MIEYCTINVTAITSVDKVEVEWNQYAGCSVGNYEIYRHRINEPTPILIATLPSTAHSYIDSSIICPVKYSYRIKATDLCGLDYSSLSDTSIASPIENVFLNQKTDVKRTTVINNSSILTEWKQPEIMPYYVSNYILLRSTDNMNFFFLDSIPAGIHQYIDDNVNIDEQNYYYKIDVLNTCQIVSDPGLKGSSILVKANVINGQSVLQWTSYDNWDTDVDYYLIERKNEYGEWEPAEKVDGTTTVIKLD